MPGGIAWVMECAYAGALMKRWWVSLILLLSFLGLADSAYLAQQYIRGESLQCDIGGALSDCNIVAQSAFSNLLGIPLPLYGVAFYAGMFILAAVELLLFRTLYRRLLQLGAAVGLAVSAIFFVIQKFFIQAYCIYCIISALIALLIFVLAWFLEPMPRLRKPKPLITPPPRPPHLLMPPAP